MALDPNQKAPDANVHRLETRPKTGMRIELEYPKQCDGSTCGANVDRDVYRSVADYRYRRGGRRGTLAACRRSAVALWCHSARDWPARGGASCFATGRY